jgi:hypothetical protein
MSGKLDQSLDTIVAARRKSARPLRRTTRRVGAGAKPAVSPIGGVKKPTRPAKKGDKVTVPAASMKPESKIMVSNLVSIPILAKDRPNLSSLPMSASSRSRYV